MDARSTPECGHGTVLTTTTVAVTSGKFSHVLRVLLPYIEMSINSLIRIKYLTVGDALQSVVDQGLYNPRLSALFDRLWNARLEHAEERPVDAFMDSLLETTLEESETLRNDALLFWLTLLSQNYPLDFDVFILLLQPPLEPALQTFVDATRQWQLFESPVEVKILSSVEL